MTDEQTTHTPGPWDVGILRRRDVDSGKYLRPHYFVVDDTDERASANARLIAAAPDLLDACRSLVERADDSDDERDALRIADVFTLIDLVLRPAVSKAVGDDG